MSTKQVTQSETKWQVWRLSDEAGGNLVVHQADDDDVCGNTLNSTLVEEFDTFKDADAFIEKDIAKFLCAFKLKDKRVVKGERIWTGKEEKLVNGFSYAFRKHCGRRDWTKIVYHDKPKEFVPKSVKYIKGSVRLLNAGRKWWLHYGKNHNNGGFKNRNEALKWYLGGGR